MSAGLRAEIPHHPMKKILIALFLAGCAGTGQSAVDYEATAKIIVPNPIELSDMGPGAILTVDTCRMAFGPAYFCAARSGSPTLCETAAAELAEIHAIDCLNPAPQALGTVEGFVGEIRSISYDFGLHWFLTESRPAAGAEAPGGHSLQMTGHLDQNGKRIEFTANIDVLPQYQGQRAVTTAPARATITEETAGLTVQFNPGAWIQAVDWKTFLETGQNPIEIGPELPGHSAVLLEMVSGAPPAFTWTAR